MEALTLQAERNLVDDDSVNRLIVCDLERGCLHGQCSPWIHQTGPGET
jgi:hypothetical protein